jgi:kynurenine formamidase
MIDLSRYRVIDLSYSIMPGERKIDGRYLHGEPFYGRWTEVQEFIAYGARMHFVQTQTHLGTHAEAPYKYSEAGADLGSMPPESYMGEAVVCKFSDKSAGEAIGVEDIKKFGIKAGDIVLLWARAGLAQPPYLTFDVIDWLIATKVKMVCFENVRFSPPGTPFGKDDADGKLLTAGVTVVDAIVGLDQIRKPRVFFIGLPLKIHRVTAFCCRAVALEEKD